jgi:hypothetical protein
LCVLRTEINHLDAGRFVSRLTIPIKTKTPVLLSTAHNFVIRSS